MAGQAEPVPPREPWWQAQGFETLDEAMDDFHRQLDRDGERLRRRTGEALVGAPTPEGAKELPDPRFGRTFARRYQVNFKLNYFERVQLRALAEECALPTGTLARMLVMRGVRATQRAFDETDRALEVEGWDQGGID